MAREVDSYITKKKDTNFQSVEALQSVVNVVTEAAAALNVGTGNNLESLFTEEELKRNQQEILQLNAEFNQLHTTPVL